MPLEPHGLVAGVGAAFVLLNFNVTHVKAEI